MKIWFLMVVIISITITINAIFINNNYSFLFSIISFIIATLFGVKKVFWPNRYINYLTDLLIYPGISIIFIYAIFIQNNPTINIISLFTILFLISIYDIWAVNKSKIMIKMAKYQIEKLNIFGGILVPIISKKDKLKIKHIKNKYKNKKDIEKQFIKSKIKVSAAVLGGGDIAFTTITIGFFMYSFPEMSLFGVLGLIPALFVLLGASLGLLYIFIFGDKKKPYPAMPYISFGIVLTTLVFRILFI